ncbi:hypothetical protein L1987_59594 [Smallanthus sonchifolius]|uniref:Uncharacterized protein n=1 Tax=Smallanthus sonchifolius TaxID=185202 RepID=A0ACB9D5W8_9ASTR|nr:hypothetical protein L1987_59594 [Smallanthus sonchifolius]
MNTSHLHLSPSRKKWSSSPTVKIRSLDRLEVGFHTLQSPLRWARNQRFKKRFFEAEEKSLKKSLLLSCLTITNSIYPKPMRKAILVILQYKSANNRC